ncbi:hypothetical protein [Kiritimatiella glycovorans]|uniref:Uncharacterized protein n=1 Tax=Kiritimatiella glycovorans TaxID=1307763 RepID=A0A0G3EDS1_9BACT|nr:hypothetical protein [Kiritimatiella glycovorans]AKJ63552.1 hypothetical protein L21SP4_00271 [Kiritimatiella glycovorans]
MSLIQEALKRKSEEGAAGEGSGEDGSATPPTPPPLPPGGGRSRKGPRVALLIVLLLLAAGAGGYLWLRGRVRNTTEDFSSAISKHVARDIRQPRAEPDAAGAEPQAPAPAPQKAEPAEETGEDAEAGAPEKDEPPSAIDKLLSRAGGESRSGGWPALRVEGFGSGTEGGWAIINGDVLSVGDTVDGVTLRAVEKREIVVEYRSMTRRIGTGKH